MVSKHKKDIMSIITRIKPGEPFMDFVTGKYLFFLLSGNVFLYKQGGGFFPTNHEQYSALYFGAYESVTNINSVIDDLWNL